MGKLDADKPDCVGGNTPIAHIRRAVATTNRRTGLGKGGVNARHVKDNALDEFGRQIGLFNG